MTHDAAHWAAFLAAAVLLNLSPGPDMAFILANAVRGGRRAGAAAMAGVWTGALVHVVLAAAGLTAIVAASATAFALVKWVGAAYLVWIGLRALRARPAEGTDTDTDAAPGGGTRVAEGRWAVYRQGVLVDLLNPKVAVFFLAFLPQFVVQGAGPAWAQLLVHGVLVIVVGAAVEVPLLLVADRMSARMRGGGRLSGWMDKAFGAGMIALGLRLAAADR